MSKQLFRVWRASGVSLAVAFVLAMLAWAALPQQLWAVSDQPLDVLANITVNTSDPNINSDGQCSIIEAIENANANSQVYADCAAGSGSDTISLPNEVITFTNAHNLEDGGNALPVITSTITIQGNGASLVRDSSVEPLFRFFDVFAGGNLTLLDLAMQNGRPGLAGTALVPFNGGAILNEGTLSIRGGNLSFNQGNDGGAIYSAASTGSLALVNTTFSSNEADSEGGAIYNAGTAAITASTLQSNKAIGDGGAILNDSSRLTVNGVIIQDNTSSGSGAGIAARTSVSNSHITIVSTNIISNVAGVNGGGLYNNASSGLTSLVEIAGALISANHADSTLAGEGIGGGILNGWAAAGDVGTAELLVSRSTIADNVAQVGGGIANVDLTGLAERTVSVEIERSTLVGNLASGNGALRGLGGGLYNSNGDAVVVNSTLSGNQAVGDNSASGGRGGGISSSGNGIATTLTLLNSTIAFNEASQAGGGVSLMQQVTATETTMDVGNTLIVSNLLATNSATNASPQILIGTESCSIENAVSTSLGGNIEDGATCGFTTETDLQETSIFLGPLANNGGPTDTHLIANDGPAFNSGVAAICAAAPVSAIDQRNIVRPQGPECDRGAVELEPGTPPLPEIRFPEIYLRFTFE